jgi:uncharacterized repeat protein (TIGR01451 family)
MRKKPTKSLARWFLAIVLSAMAAPLRAATPAGTLIVNVATVEYTAGPSDLPTIVQSNQAVTQVAPAQALLVSKSADPAGPVPPGSFVTFSLLVENPGTTDLSDVVISDPLDPLLSPPAVVATGSVPNRSPSGCLIAVSGAYIAATRTVRWDVRALPAGARFELSFTAQVSALAPEDSVVRNVTTQINAGSGRHGSAGSRGRHHASPVDPPEPAAAAPTWESHLRF